MKKWYLCRRKAPFIYKMMLWHKTYCNVHVLAYSSKKIWNGFAFLPPYTQSILFCCRHVVAMHFKARKFMSRSAPPTRYLDFLVIIYFPLLWSSCMSPSRWILRHSDQQPLPRLPITSTTKRLVPPTLALQTFSVLRCLNCEEQRQHLFDVFEFF